MGQDLVGRDAVDGLQQDMQVGMHDVGDPEKAAPGRSVMLCLLFIKTSSCYNIILL